MKTKLCPVCLPAVVGVITCLAVSSGLAANTASVPAAAGSGTPAATDTAAPKLPYGVADVVKLNRAQVSEDVILTYVQNSGTVYNLGPQEIVYLHEQGVSDRVINTMQDQRKKATEATAQTAPPAAPAPQTYADTATVAAAPAYYQPAPVCVQPAPVYVPASTLYVIPYYGSGYYVSSGYYRPYYGGYCGSYRPYYGSYYGGCYRPSVAVSVGFGFGGHGYGHGFHHR
jgi:hypothetical protein